MSLSSALKKLYKKENDPIKQVSKENFFIHPVAERRKYGEKKKEREEYAKWKKKVFNPKKEDINSLIIRPYNVSGNYPQLICEKDLNKKENGYGLSKTYDETTRIKLCQSFNNLYTSLINPSENTPLRRMSSYFDNKFLLENQTPCILIIGAPSSGKSALLKYFIANWRKVINTNVTVVTQAFKTFNSMKGVKPIGLNKYMEKVKVVETPIEEEPTQNAYGLDERLLLEKKGDKWVKKEINTKKVINAIEQILIYYESMQNKSAEHNEKPSFARRLLIVDDCFTSIKNKSSWMMALTTLIKNRNAYNLTILLTSQGPFKLTQDLLSAINYSVFLSWRNSSYFKRAFTSLLSEEDPKEYFYRIGKDMVHKRQAIVIKNGFTPRDGLWAVKDDYYRLGKMHHYTNHMASVFFNDTKPDPGDKELAELEDYGDVYEHLLSSLWQNHKNSFKMMFAVKN